MFYRRVDTKTKRDLNILLLLIFIISLTIGYAILSSGLNILGTTTISSSKWDIHWENVTPTTNLDNANITTAATITDDTTVTYAVKLDKPGDYYEFTVDAVNDGTIDGMISVFGNKVYAANGTTEKQLADYLEYTISYSDGVSLATNQLLSAGESETYKVKIQFKEDIEASQLPSDVDSYQFKFSVTYVQAVDEVAVETVPDPISFSTDSWVTINRAAKKGIACTKYNVGDTKTVDMGSLGTHTLRIANCSMPAECSTEGFSQTACGFVLEFADIISMHVMNSTNTNAGGWPASEMRTYVNNDIYNSLPVNLKDLIVETRVVSGHGFYTDVDNYLSKDKLYLLSPIEIGMNVNNDTASSVTRVLDYYNIHNNSNDRLKLLDSSNEGWRLRTAYSSGTESFYYVYYGSYSTHVATISLGVSPAFRIA